MCVEHIRFPYWTCEAKNPSRHSAGRLDNLARERSPWRSQLRKCDSCVMAGFVFPTKGRRQFDQNPIANERTIASIPATAAFGKI